MFHGLKESSYAEVAFIVNRFDLEGRGSRRQGATDQQNAGLIETNLDSEKAVLDLCNDVRRVKVGHTDISVAHRLPTRQKGPRSQSAPIIVRFTNRRVCTAV